MDERDARRAETESLIEAIWGPQPAPVPTPVDPALRATQNLALADALKAYLQQYLADAEAEVVAVPPPA